MTSGRGAPPLPPPPPPADSACAISQAAQAATRAWAPPMDPAGHGRALSQLHSILRDLGIAIRGLARYQTTGYPADAPPPDFPQHIAASAERLLDACQQLDGMLAAEGLGPVPDPGEPGAILCRGARTAITAWGSQLAPVPSATSRSSSSSPPSDSSRPPDGASPYVRPGAAPSACVRWPPS